MRSCILRMAAVLFVCAALFGSASPVQAGVIIEIDILINGVEKASATSAPNAGSLLFSGPVGGYTITVNASANPLVGTPQEAEVDQLSGTVTSGTTAKAGTVEIKVSTINNTFSPAPPPSSNGNLEASIGGTDTHEHATITMTAGWDNSNVEDSTASGHVTIGPLTPNPTFSGVASTTGPVVGGPFSLLNDVLVSFNSQTLSTEIVTWDADTHLVTPEPTTLAIWGLGAVGLAYVARRRKKAEAAG